MQKGKIMPQMDRKKSHKTKKDNQEQEPKKLSSNIF